MAFFLFLCAFFNLEHSLGINIFKPTILCQIIEVIATQAKFLGPSSYSSEINCAFSFCTKTVFGCFNGVIAQYQNISRSFRIWLHCLFICATFKSPTEWSNVQHVSALTNYWDTTNHIGYHLTAQSPDILTTNFHLSKYCKIFDSP